jgi:hypothetical protein
VKSTFKADGGKTVEREDTLLARQEDGGWKLILGYPPRGVTAAQKAAAARVTREVRDGRYKDRLAAMVALANAWGGKGAK